MISDQLFTVPEKLGKRQELVYALFTHFNAIKASHAGLMLHENSGCKHCGPTYEYPCQFAVQDGRAVLESLRKRGLLRRDRHHIYSRATEPAAISVDDPVDWGGF